MSDEPMGREDVMEQEPLASMRRSIFSLVRDNDVLREKLAQVTHALGNQETIAKAYENAFCSSVKGHESFVQEIANAIDGRQQDGPFQYSLAIEINTLREELAKVKEGTLDRIACHQREIAGWEMSVQQLQARLAELEEKLKQVTQERDGLQTWINSRRVPEHED